MRFFRELRGDAGLNSTPGREESRRRRAGASGAGDAAEIAGGLLRGPFLRIWVSGRGRGSLVVMACRLASNRRALMPASAEADESRGRVIDLRLAGTLPEIPPVVFERMDVIARRSVAAFFVSLVGQGRQSVLVRGQGALDPLALTVEEDDHV